MQPTLTIELDDSLPEAAFHLVRARIAWGDGNEAEGWGRDTDAAIAQKKAVAEAVERGAYRRLPKSAVMLTADKAQPAIPPDRLVSYSARQYARSDFPFKPFSAARHSWWLPAISATGDGECLALADCVCSYRAFDVSYRNGLFTHATTSGCASGTTWDEALARATLELVERDAFMRHWLLQRPGVAVDPASLPDWARDRRAHLMARGCDVWVQCLTLGAHPVWLITAQHTGKCFSTVGTACGFDADNVLNVAWQEMETIALARLAGVPPTLMTPELVNTPADHSALYATTENFRSADTVILGHGTCRPYGELAPHFESDALTLFDTLGKRECPVYGVDLSLQEAANILDGDPLLTVRAISPGLIPLTFGHGLLPLGMVPDHAHVGIDVHPLC